MEVPRFSTQEPVKKALSEKLNVYRVQKPARKYSEEEDPYGEALAWEELDREERIVNKYFRKEEESILKSYICGELSEECEEDIDSDTPVRKYASTGFWMQWDSDENITFYKRDEKFDKWVSELEEYPGTTEQETIKYAICNIEQYFLDGDAEGVLSQLYIINLLAPELRRELRDFYRVPEELFVSNMEQYIEVINGSDLSITSFRNNILQKRLLLIFLKNVGEELENEAEKRYFGFREINPTSLYRFIDYIDNPSKDDPHRSFYYYLYMRHVLPESIVREFEEYTYMHIPERLSNIASEEEFFSLETSDFDELGESEKTGYETWPENSLKTIAEQPDLVRLLKERLHKLAEKIRPKLPRTEKVTVDEMFRLAGIPEADITESRISNYLELMGRDNRVYIEEQLGFSIGALDLPAQLSFLEYLSGVESHEFNSLIQGFEEYTIEERVAIASCFLAFREEPEFMYMILRLMKHKEVMVRLAVHVHQLIGNASSLRAFLTQEFGKDVHVDFVTKLHAQLISKAYELFLKYNAKITNNELDAEIEEGHKYLDEVEEDEYDDFSKSRRWNEDVSTGSYDDDWEIVDEIKKECGEHVFDQTLFLNSFKTLRTTGESIDLESIRSSKMRRVRGNELTQEEINEMASIYESNQQGRASKQALLKKFKERVSGGISEFAIFSWKDKIQSFMVMDKTPDGYFMSGFNVSPESRGYKIGESMLAEVIDVLASEGILSASCLADLPISARYIESGWVGYQIYEEQNPESNSVDVHMEIKRNDAQSDIFWGKKTLDILSITPPTHVRLERAKNQKDLPFYLLNEGYYLSRILKKDNEFIGVFEEKTVVDSYKSKGT